MPQPSKKAPLFALLTNRLLALGILLSAFYGYSYIFKGGDWEQLLGACFFFGLFLLGSFHRHTRLSLLALINTSNLLYHQSGSTLRVYSSHKRLNTIGGVIVFGILCGFLSYVTLLISMRDGFHLLVVLFFSLCVFFLLFCILTIYYQFLPILQLNEKRLRWQELSIRKAKLFASLPLREIKEIQIERYSYRNKITSDGGKRYYQSYSWFIFVYDQKGERHLIHEFESRHPELIFNEAWEALMLELKTAVEKYGIPIHIHHRLKNTDEQHPSKYFGANASAPSKSNA